MAFAFKNSFYVNVYDYTGKPCLSTYALEQTPLTFVPDYTNIQILSSRTYVSALSSLTNTFYIPDNNDYSDIKIRWDFGDGTYQVGPTGVHAYTFPGSYKTRVYLIDSNGSSYLNEFVVNIKVYNYIQDKYLFEPYKDFIVDIPAGRLSDKITIQRTNSWQSYEPLSGTGYTFNLYASGSGTYYYDVKNYYTDKWAHLKKFFKFVKKETINNIEQDIIVDKVITSNTELYAKIFNKNIVPCSKTDSGAFLVGTSGSAEFYYTDDSNKNNISTNDPIFIFATLDTSKFYDSIGLRDNVYSELTPLQIGYLNTLPICLPIVKTRYNPAAAVTITTNGLDGEGKDTINTFNLNKVNFAGTKIPFVVKLKDQDNFTTKSYPYLSSTNAFPLTSYFFNIKLVDSTGNEVLSTTFYKTDFEKEIFKSGGFYRGYFTTDSTVVNAKLSTTVYIDDIPNFEQDTALLFYAQPYSDNIARYFSTSFYSSIPGINNSTATTYDFLNTQGNRSIFTITQIPSSNNAYDDYCFWAADSDSDTILKMTYTGNIITTINLSATPFSNGTTKDLRNIYGSAAPSCIAIDQNNNAFVTLFDSGSVIKINNLTNTVDAICIPPTSVFATNTFLTSADYVANQGWAGEFTILPSSVDTDNDGNVYVAYSHPMSSTIVKFDNNLNYQKKMSGIFGTTFYAQKLVIDRNNNIWATAINKNATSSGLPFLSGRDDVIYVIRDTGNTNLTPLTTFRGFNQPCNITVDGNQSCWVSHGTSTVTKIEFNPITLKSNRYDFNMGSVFGNTSNYLQSIEGMSCNSLNEIVILNNFDLKIYFLDASSTIQPDLNTMKQIPIIAAPNNFSEYPLSAYYDSKYQAYGDFLGYNWINKYYYNSANTRLISGCSTTFDIYPASGNNLLIKINENFDGTEMYKNFALMETLKDKPTFFNEFLGKIVGNFYSNVDNALLKKIYEKIANFSDNITDIDVCNIDSLISKCNMFEVIYDNYNYPYPPSLKRVIDIASIKRSKLFGSQNTNNYSFKYGNNVGDQLNVDNDTFSATEIIVAQEKFSNIFKPVNTTIINGYSATDIIPLRDFNYYWGWGLVAPASLSGANIQGYYNFYRLKLTNQPIYDNLLEFNNTISNISYNLSSHDDFYGEGGVIDQNITYSLVNGLRLITSAMNVYYN